MGKQSRLNEEAKEPLLMSKADMDANVVDLVRSKYGQYCKVEPIESYQPEISHGRTVYRFAISHDDWTCHAELLFKQSVKCAENEVRALSLATVRGINVPQTIMSDVTMDNVFGAPYILREHVKGKLLCDDRELLKDKWPVLVNAMCTFHNFKQEALDAPNPWAILELSNRCRPILSAPGFDKYLFQRRVDETITFLTMRASELRVPAAVDTIGGIGGDSILTTSQGKLYFLNWENSSCGDFCKDLAPLYAVFTEYLNANADGIFNNIIDTYGHVFQDSHVSTRLAYNVVEYYLRCIAVAAAQNLKIKLCQSALKRLDAFCSRVKDWPVAEHKTHRGDGLVRPEPEPGMKKGIRPENHHDHFSFPCLRAEWDMRVDVRRIFLFEKDLEDTGELLRGGFIHPTEAIVISMCDGTKTLQKVEEDIMSLFDVDADNACTQISNILARWSDAIELRSNTSGRDLLRRSYDPMSFIIPSYKIDLETARLYKPAALVIHVSDDCMRNCIYCNVEKRKTTTSLHLPMSRWIEIFDEAAEIGIISVTLAGGDPFMRKDLPEIVRALTERGILPVLATKSLVTETMAVNLFEAGLRRMQVSIDAPSPGLADLITQSKGYFSDAIQSIRNIRAAGMTVRCNCVMTRINVNKAYDLVALLANMGVDSIALTGFSRSLYIQDDLNDDLFLSESDRSYLESVTKRFTGIKVRTSISQDSGSLPSKEKERGFSMRSQCSAGRWGFVVHSDGLVTLCDEMPLTSTNIVGDLKTESIMEIWQSSRIEKVTAPSRSLFRDSACFACQEFSECHQLFGRCFRDAYKAFGTLWSPSPACPRAPQGRRLT